MQQQSLIEALSFVKTAPKFHGVSPLTFDETLSLYERLVLLIESSPAPEEYLHIARQRVNEAIIDLPLTEREIGLVLTVIEELEESRKVRHKSHRRPNSALSRIAKRRWTRYKEKYKRALKKFWRSGRSKHFSKTLTTAHAPQDVQVTDESTAVMITREEVLELMKAVSSGLTHYIIELHVQERDTHALLEEDVELLIEMTDLTNAMLQDLATSLTLDDQQRNDVYEDCLSFSQEVFTELPVEVSF
jgi:hypothetical protein